MRRPMSVPSERAVPFCSVLSIYAKGLVRDTLRPAYPMPKNRSKKPFNFSMMVCFFSARFPPPKREIGGISLSMSVPVVLTEPSRKALSIKRRVSSSFRFSSWMIVTSCRSFSSATKVRHSSITSDTSLIPAIKVSISAFLLRSSGLASTALRIVISTSLSSQCESWYFCTRSRM